MTRWRASLAAKALGLQLAGLLAIAVVVGAARYYAIRHQLYRQVEGSAEALAQVLEDLLAEHPELMHTASLDPVVERFSRKLPAVARVSVVDPAGVIVADSRASEGRPTEQPEAQPLLTKVGEMRSSYTQAGSRVLRVSRSLRGRYDAKRRSDIVGAVLIDMRLALTDAAAKRELLQEMTLVLLLFVPIGGLMYFRTRRSFVRPLEQLAAAEARFARGEMPAPLAFTAGDELGAVARTFNDMVKTRARALAETEELLKASVAEAKVLRGILPICANCKRIRTDQGSWEQIESYVHEHSEAQFSHGLCPECAAKTWG